MSLPTTPDGRYFIVRGRLWRCSNPALERTRREGLVKELMAARSAVGRAFKAGDEEAMRVARAQVNQAKLALGERGLPWWDDGAPDYNRRLARNTPYADWARSLSSE